MSGQLTHVVQADSTDEDALRQLSVHEFDRVVVAIGNDVEASILTASLILQLGVPNVWAKAIIEFDDDFAMAETTPPTALLGSAGDFTATTVTRCWLRRRRALHRPHLSAASIEIRCDMSSCASQKRTPLIISSTARVRGPRLSPELTITVAASTDRYTAGV